jgi:predicted nucleotidyltransferase
MDVMHIRRVIIMNITSLNKFIDFLNEIKNNYSDVNIYLFGSHIWGTPRRDSDIDIAIDTNSMYDFFDISEEIEECNSIFNFDILNFKTINNDYLKERILKYGKQI